MLLVLNPQFNVRVGSDVDDTLGQLRVEIIRLVFLGVAGGVSLIAAIIGFLVRRDLKRSATAEEAFRNKCAEENAERGLKLESLIEEYRTHVTHSGSEIKTIQYRVGIMATEIKQRIPEVTIPEWPSR